MFISLITEIVPQYMKWGTPTFMITPIIISEKKRRFGVNAGVIFVVFLDRQGKISTGIDPKPSFFFLDKIFHL